MTIQILLIKADKTCMLSLRIPRIINQYMRFAWKVDFRINYVSCTVLINSIMRTFSLDPCHSLYHHHHH